MSEEKLKALRVPFPENQISKLPKPTKAQTNEVKQDFKKGMRCTVCGGWHHPKVIHLDYVGHAALTDRLLDVDPEWNWKPLAVTEHGLPVYDSIGGMWIELTVCGVTRLGYGNAGEKKGGDAIKEVIGDALRNAGMRFGMALDLWHKGDLHIDEPDNSKETQTEPSQECAKYIKRFKACNDIDSLHTAYNDAKNALPDAQHTFINNAVNHKKKELAS